MNKGIRIGVYGVLLAVPVGAVATVGPTAVDRVEVLNRLGFYGPGILAGILVGMIWFVNDAQRRA